MKKNMCIMSLFVYCVLVTCVYFRVSNFNLSLIERNDTLIKENAELKDRNQSLLSLIPTPTPTPIFSQNGNVPAEYEDMCNEVKSVLGENAKVNLSVVIPTLSPDNKVNEENKWYKIDFVLGDIWGEYYIDELKMLKNELSKKTEVKYCIDEEFSDEKNIIFESKKIKKVKNNKASLELACYKEDEGRYIFVISDVGGGAIISFDQKGNSTKLAEKIMLSFIQK